MSEQESVLRLSDPVAQRLPPARFEFALSVALLAGLLVLSIVASLYVVLSVSLVVGRPIVVPTVVGALGLGLALWARLAWRLGSTKIAAGAVGATLAATAVSVAVAGTFLDLSYDGQTYHQEAILQMANGWNPAYDTLVPRTSDEAELYLWTNSYPKATEIVQTAIYELTGWIESTKTLNVMLLFASFCLSWVALCRLGYGRPSWSMVLSLLAAANPIVVCQVLTTYVDGVLASLFLSVAALAYLYVGTPSVALAVLLVPTLACLLNVKYNAIILYAVLGATLLGLLFFNRMTRPFRSVAAILLVGAAIAFALGPYVRNTIEHGHPLYPILRSDGRDVSSVERPQVLTPVSAPERLAVSLFAVATIAVDRTELKVPFSVSTAEIEQFFFPDVRLGGFGPLFSGVVVLTIVLAVAARATFRERRSLSFILAALCLSVLINPEPWWARYIFQLWFVPLGIILVATSRAQTRSTAVLAGLTGAVMAANVLVVAVPHVWMQRQATKGVEAQLQEVASMPAPVAVDFHEFRSNRARLLERGIAYTEVTNLRQLGTWQLAYSKTEIRRETR